MAERGAGGITDAHWGKIKSIMESIDIAMESYEELRSVNGSTQIGLCSLISRLLAKLEIKFIKATGKCLEKLNEADISKPIRPNTYGLNANLISSLGRMLESGLESDVVLKCGPDSFPAHKFILSARSSVLKALLTEATSDIITLTIEGSEPAVFKHLLQFMYTAKVELNDKSQEEIIGLIAAAAKYEVTDLKSFCFQQLLVNLNEQTCGKLAVAAYVHGADLHQRNLIFEYNAAHWKELVAKKEFQVLLKENLEAFFKPE